MILKYSIFLTGCIFHFYLCSASYGDTCQINGLEPEVLKSLSYEPPNKELLSTGQNQKAWQTFIENYEIPIRKVQDWYNSIVDKQSADAAADLIRDPAAQRRIRAVRRRAARRGRRSRSGR